MEDYISHSHGVDAGATACFARGYFPGARLVALVCPGDLTESDPFGVGGRYVGDAVDGAFLGFHVGESGAEGAVVESRCGA